MNLSPWFSEEKKANISQGHYIFFAPKIYASVKVFSFFESNGEEKEGCGVGYMYKESCWQQEIEKN